MTLMLRYAARSDVGLIRDTNQDSVYAGPRLLAVADGMGGHAAGDVASRVVVSILSSLDDDAVGGDLVDALRKATMEANQHLQAMVEGDSDLDGMGTTLTAMLFGGNRFGMVHVGDSRAYLMRDGELSQITKDDTFVQSLVDEGRITADEATTHPQRSLLLRVLTGQDVEPYFSVREAVAGDRYLLCSDGLSGVVSEDTIAEALEIDDPQESADRLVDLALRAGAPDNVTCAVADIVEGTVGPDEPVIGGAVAEYQTQRAPKSDSAAGRAALARPARPEPARAPEDTSDPKRSRRRLIWITATVALVVLAGLGSLIGWRYVQGQYFVASDDDGTVAIFQGVTGQVIGIKLSRVSHRTELNITDLQPVVRREVRQGIIAGSLGHADTIVERLRTQQLPECPPAPGASPQPSTTPKPASTARPASPKPAPKPTGSVRPSASPSPSSLVPGEDCRKPRA
ncbi:MAG: protein phosphatase 2C domain-containing protein [Mycobacteriales bacterium]